MVRPKTIAVIGAGVVGVACAIELQRRGKRVTLIDRNVPGSGCSSGNAGIIAASEIFPLVAPAQLVELPLALWSDSGPASIRFASLPDTGPWFIRAAMHLGSKRQAQLTDALQALNGRALASWRELLSSVALSSELIERGMLELAADARTWARVRNRATILSDRGLKAIPISKRDLNDLEPALAADLAGAILHADNAHVRDPLALVTKLCAAARRMGVVTSTQDVRAALPDGGQVTVQTDAEPLRFDQVVIAAGLESRDLMHKLGRRVPMIAERGYHLMVRHWKSNGVSRPLSLAREGCVATPLASGLRLAGTVEFASPETRPNWRRAAVLGKHAQHYLKDIVPDSRVPMWMGCRPSLPDSLPAIGRLKDSPVFYAFGHQHLGLTQAAVTAWLVGSLAEGHETDIEIAPYSLDRFARY